MKRVFRILRELFFPPHCAACGKRLEPSLSHVPTPVICAACNIALEQAMHRQCPQCLRELYRCRCMPRAMQKAGYGGLVKLCFYGKDADNTATRGLILRMKDRDRPAVFTQCADWLTAEARVAVAEADAGRLTALCQSGEPLPRTPRPTVITWLPRSARAHARAGHDQAERLATALAAQMGYPAVKLFARRRGKQQKKLKSASRRANLARAFALVGDCCGARVLVVDDVVTTGATMAEAARLLTAAGAAELIGVCVGVTPLQKQEKFHK